jgi:hypothetical protein
MMLDSHADLGRRAWLACPSCGTCPVYLLECDINLVYLQCAFACSAGGTIRGRSPSKPDLFVRRRLATTRRTSGTVVCRVATLCVIGSLIRRCPEEIQIAWSTQLPGMSCVLLSAASRLPSLLEIPRC